MFTIGGAFAVTKSYMVIAQLTGGNGGANETQQMLAGLNSTARMAKGAYKLGLGGVAQVLGGSQMRKNLGKNRKQSRNLQGAKLNEVADPNTSKIADNANEQKSKTDGQLDSNNVENDNDSATKTNKFKQGLTTVGNIASMPVSVVKSLYTKGAVGSAKTLWQNIKSKSKSTNNEEKKS